jgi:hypothetical protein
MEGFALRVSWSYCSRRNEETGRTVYKEQSIVMYSRNHASIELVLQSISGKYSTICVTSLVHLHTRHNRSRFSYYR